jgi:hypothetical protein
MNILMLMLQKVDNILQDLWLMQIVNDYITWMFGMLT